MMNLGYMRRHLREMLKEPDPTNSLWTDLTLNEWLNEAARVMTAIGKQDETPHQFTCTLQPGSTTDYQREYIMPSNFKRVVSASLFNGMEQRLTYKEYQRSLLNNSYSGVPTHFYIRERTKKRVETSAAGIVLSDIDSQKKSRKIFGLDPRPTSAFVVTVNMFTSHPWMRTDGDEPTIPYEYRRGIIEYAAAQAFKSDEMYAQANLAMAEYGNFAGALRDDMISRGQDTEFPVVKIRDDEDTDFVYEVYRIP